jgi:hypothetical protein
MLDVFASAMGAFLIIMVILLPYYHKDYETLVAQIREQQRELDQQRQTIQQQQQQIEQQQNRIGELESQNQQQQNRIEELENQNQNSQATIQQQRQEIEQQQSRLEQLERENRGLREQLEKTFLIVVIDWKTRNHDVDLHVIDPSGNEFYFEKKTFSGVPGKLSEDTTNGPGVEVWEISDAPPGTYKIYYNFYSKNGNSNSTVVSGRVYFRDGTKHFRRITLTQEKEKPLVATITVESDGQVSIQQ